MKKWIVLLLFVLLARVPSMEWGKLPNKPEFLRLLAVVFCEKYECKKAVVGIIELKDEVFFFGDCVLEEVML